MDCDKTSSSKLDLDNLRVIKLLGKGAMGTVFLVHDSSNHDEPFALKVVERSSAKSHNVDRRARHEVSVLGRLSETSIQHPFLPRLIASYENQDFIGWGIPFCPGGDLNVHRYRQNDHVFSTSVIRFYVAEIVCALEYLHDQGIVYRDLKPENILVQQSGHVTLTDFDRNILFEEPNFIGKHNSLMDLIGKLLEKDPTRRLGYLRGACEIKEHDFFNGLKWDKLEDVLRPPYLPIREETEVIGGGITVREYFEKLKVPLSPSIDEHRNNILLTEF